MPNDNPHIANSLLNSFKAFVGSHFLLNIINGIQSDVILKAHKSAFETLQLFNRVYKLALKQSNEQFASVEETLTFLKVYGALEQIRFPNRKFPTINQSGTNAETSVPTFVFQPFLENAWLLFLESKAKSFKVSVSTEEESCTCMIDLKSDAPIHSKSKAKIDLAMNRLELLQDSGLINYTLDWHKNAFFHLTIQTL